MATRTLIILILLTVFIGLSTDILAQTKCESPVGGFCVKLQSPPAPQEKKMPFGLAIVVPGIEFLGLSTSASLGEIFIAVYNFMLGLVAISSLVWLTLGGVWFITAGDNAGRISQAKKWMGNAIFGLVLALLSYIILYTINPQLVTLKKNVVDLQEITPGQASQFGSQSGTYVCNCELGITYPSSQCYFQGTENSACPTSCTTIEKCTPTTGGDLYACGGCEAGKAAFADDPSCGVSIGLPECPAGQSCTKC